MKNKVSLVGLLILTVAPGLAWSDDSWLARSFFSALKMESECEYWVGDFTNQRRVNLRAINTLDYTVRRVELKLTVYDCPSNQFSESGCLTVAQSRFDMGDAQRLAIPPGQARDFDEILYFPHTIHVRGYEFYRCDVQGYMHPADYRPPMFSIEPEEKEEKSWWQKIID